ncbi:MAG: nucleoside recognition domain-containing protein [Desulfatiglandaceae bacterium]
MNTVFIFLIAISFLTASWFQLTSPPGESPMEAVTAAVIDSAGASVELAIGLVGVMTLFLGVMKVAEAGGMLSIISRLIRPVMIRLFPDVPHDHPAMGAMILNISANALGLGNAATPFGIKAMQELDRLNPTPGTATNAMALFLAINTSSVTLLPTGVIALRAAAGSTDPAGILPSTLFATLCSTAAALGASFLYRRFFPVENPSMERREVEENAGDTAGEASEAYPGWVSVLALLGAAALIPLSIVYGRAISPWIIPGIIVGFLAFGFFRGVRVYEVFVEGAKEGFQVAVRIIPYLVAILVAVGMFRASGALEILVGWIGPLSGKVGMPAEALPMALLRPLSGSGAYGVLASLINDPSIGPDSYTGYLVSTLQGSTETTFYVLAVYYGAVQIKRIRHTMAAALTADFFGIAGAVAACLFLFAR